MIPTFPQYSQIEKQNIDFNKTNVFCGKSSKGYGKTTFAKRDISKGEIVLKCFGKVINHQTSCISMQINVNNHFITKKWTGRYLNHSCLPNLYIKTGKGGYNDLIALIDIKKGEELTYAYYMSEYEWSEFANENYIVCLCQSENCKGKIRSFTELTKQERETLKRNKQIAKYLHYL